MAISNIAAQENRLVKQVRHEFTTAGWLVTEESADSHQLRVKAGSLSFLVKCVDESGARYKSKSLILDQLESQQRFLRSRNKPVLSVFSENYLQVHYELLEERGIFAVSIDDIKIISDLVKIGNSVPSDELTARQMSFIKNNIHYAVSVSRRCFINGDTEGAITWGKCAVNSSVGYTFAYPHLFSMFRKSGCLDMAMELGNEIRKFRPNDPEILRAMEDIALKRGRHDEAEEWKQKRVERPMVARTLNGILAKQRSEKKLAPGGQWPLPIEQKGMSTLGWLWSRLRLNRPR